jgi:NAD(P)-dependent dehydrogenase (short-subunit alcohol dehydrogenase family)
MIFRIIGINLKAVVNVSQVAAKSMIAAGKGGSIVNISSRVCYHKGHNIDFNPSFS